MTNEEESAEVGMEEEMLGALGSEGGMRAGVGALLEVKGSGRGVLRGDS